MSNVPSLLMCVGEQYYKLFEFIDEAKAHGISKRIPVNTVPEGLEKGLSKIFVAHPKAIVKVTVEGKTLADLAYALLEAGVLSQEQWEALVDLEQPFWTGQELKSGDFVPERMLDITEAFSKLDSQQARQLEKELGLQFCMGIFGFSPFGGFELVLKDNEEEIPEEFAHLEGLVEPVHVRYIDEEEDEDDTGR